MPADTITKLKRLADELNTVPVDCEVLECIADPIIVADFENRVIYSNAAAKDYFGVDITGRHLCSFIPDPWRKAFIEARDKHTQNGRVPDVVPVAFKHNDSFKAAYATIGRYQEGYVAVLRSAEHGG